MPTPNPDDLSPETLAADWQRMKAEMRPTPDTSPANVARVARLPLVRNEVSNILAAAHTAGMLERAPKEQVRAAVADLDAAVERLVGIVLADALDQQADAPTHYYVAECDNPSGGECLECGHRHITAHYAQLCADAYNAADCSWVVGERMATPNA